MRKIRGIAAYVAIISGLLVSVLPTAVMAAGSIGGRPALPRENEPRSQSIFIHTIKKGETVTDKVLVSNNSDQTETVILYAVDAIPSNTGAFTCKQKAEPVADTGKWISLERQQVQLKPGESDIIDFSIQAPQTADVGEHNACIVLESKGDEGEVNGNLRIRTRSAIRVALTIPGTLHREVGIDSYTVTVNNYRQQYVIMLQNTGNVSADTDVSVRLKSLFGETIYHNEGQYPILPGNKLELSFSNDKSPFFGGWYVAEASVTYDENAAKWGTQSAGSLKEVNAGTKVVFIMPHPLALLLIIAALGLTGWAVAYLMLRRQRERHIADRWVSYRVKEGDTLTELAVATGAGWKQIARANGIKAPYVLKTGQVIRIPKTRSAKANSRTR